MLEVMPSRRKGTLFVVPGLGKIGFAPCGRGHALENCGGYRFYLRLVSADHVNGNSQGLRQFGDILWRNHAGVIGTIREHNHNFSSGGLSGVLESEQKS